MKYLDHDYVAPSLIEKRDCCDEYIASLRSQCQAIILRGPRCASSFSQRLRVKGFS